MANDDLVPDEALVVRMEQAADALTELVGIMKVRRHLPVDGLADLTSKLYELVGEANAAAHPDDPINAKYRSRMRGEYVVTASGAKFYPFDPKAEEVTHLDLVIGLATQPRYNGQTSEPANPYVPRPVSVGEHSIKAAAIAELLCERDELGPELTILASLHTLLHDGHEYVWGDIIRPIERRLYDVMTGRPASACKQEIHDVILEAYGLGPVPAEVDSIVREADQLAFSVEVMTIRRTDEDNDPILPVTPEIMEAGRIKPQAPHVSVVLKLLDSEIRRLVQTVGGRIPGPQTSPLDAAEATVDTTHALETLRKLKQVPGEEEPYQALGPEEFTPKDTGFIPKLNRTPRSSDVSESSWRDQVQEAISVPTPSKLIAEIQQELNDPETPELKRKVLQEELRRLESVAGE